MKQYLAITSSDASDAEKAKQLSNLDAHYSLFNVAVDMENSQSTVSPSNQELYTFVHGYTIAVERVIVYNLKLLQDQVAGRDTTLDSQLLFQAGAELKPYLTNAP